MTWGFRQAAARVLLKCLKSSSWGEEHCLADSIRWVPNLHAKRVVIQLPLQNVQERKTVDEPKETLFANGRELQGVDWIDDNEKVSSFSISVDEFCKHIVDDINTFPSSFWKSLPDYRENVVIEFSSPNLAKPFHYGHLRSTIIGNCVANLHHALGHRVTRLNYLGDWGTQYGLLGVGLKTNEQELALEEDPMNHLLQIYVKMNGLVEKDPSLLEQARRHFHLMENGNSEALAQWNRIRELSTNYLRKTYKRLGVEFDEYHAESMYGQEAKKVAEQCAQLGILSTCSDGALAVKLECTKETNPAILSKTDGTSVYLSRDVAAAIDRKNRYNFDKMYYVVENGQNNHFSALSSVLKKMGFEWHNTIHHLKFGLVYGMSTRKGDVVFLHDVIDYAQRSMLQAMKASPNTRVHEAMDPIAENLGLSAIIVNDLQKLRQRTYSFTWNEVVKLKANPGVQLQYTHARLCSLLDTYKQQLNIHSFDSHFTNELSAIHLVECLSRYDNVLRNTLEQLQPCILVKYLLELRHLINSAFKALTVKDQTEEVAQARLCVFQAAKTVLSEGMKILGLRPLNEM